jgi:riboflavin synthase
MFTGLIENIGKILSISTNQILIESKLNIGAVGESIAVNGVCLTVKSFNANGFSADVSPETLKLSNLERLHAGECVNLEKSLRLESLLGGHLVLGHVDGVVRLLKAAKSGSFYEFWFEMLKNHEGQLVKKGSVAIDGISLTIADIKDNMFSVWVIPETYESTNLKHKKPHDYVNIETDILGKYIEKQLGMQKSGSRINYALLEKRGFV